MRYVITQSQFHTLVYRYLDGLFSNEDFRKEDNEYNPNAWRMRMYTNKGENLLSFFWYGPGEYDDGSPHTGVGNLHIHYGLVDNLRNNLTVRESKVIDIIADWVSEKFNVDVDDAGIHPTNPKGTHY